MTADVLVFVKGIAGSDEEQSPMDVVTALLMYANEVAKASGLPLRVEGHDGG